MRFLFGVLAVVTCVLPGCRHKPSSATNDAGATALSEASDASATNDAGAKRVIPEVVLDDVAAPTAGDELSLRMRHLVEAIAQNNPDLASDVLFPRDAFVALKDVSNPAEAWEKKGLGAFRRDVERIHRRTEGAARAKFVSFELGGAVIQIVPKKKDFKKPLFRVRNSTLTFAVDGKVQRLTIDEMTSWRGAWYVTHLR